MRLGILTSHPVQYQVPWFRALAKEVDLEVFFAHRQSAVEQGKAGFGVAFDWDVDLLSGYKHRFLNNVSRNPGVNHHAGCDTPEIADIIEGTRGLPDCGTTGQLTTDRGTTEPQEGGEVSGQWSVVSGQRGKRFDAFIVSGWHLKSYWQAVRACHRCGVSVMVRGDSQLRTPRSLLKRLAMEVRQRWLVRQFAGFLFVGQRNREYLQHYGVPAAKLFFAPHFVDNEWFREKAEAARKHKAEIRKGWGVEDETLVALFVGKFQSIKRPGDILKALALLQHRNIEAVGVFVGSGELEAALKAEARTRGVSARFVGFKNQTEVPACYVSADVLVLPSESETWGLVVNEAMACGVPAIVSDAVGCAPDLIEEGETGFTYPAGDPAALAGALSVFAQRKRNGHVFATALVDKMRAYGVDAAVGGTLRAAKTLGEARPSRRRLEENPA